MNDRDPLHPLDYFILAGLAIYVLAVAVAVVWMIIQFVRLIHASGYGAQICGAVIVLLMMAIVIAAPRR